MSMELEDDKKQYQCLKKYEIITKQFDELIGIVDAKTRPSKRRRVASNLKGETTCSSQQTQTCNNEVLAETITKFLHDLDASEESTKKF